MKFSEVSGLVFWWPVDVMVPDTDKAGELKKFGFDAQFLQLDRDTLDALEQEPQIGKAGERGDHPLLRAALQNWRKIEGADDKPLPFTPENFEIALRNTFVVQGLYRAFYEGARGVLRKN